MKLINERCKQGLVKQEFYLRLTHYAFFAASD